MSKPLQYLCYSLLFMVSFLFFIYITFPFNILKESLLAKITRSTSLNIVVHDLSPSLLFGLEAQGVTLKTNMGEEVNFSAIDVSLSPFYLFLGQLQCAVEVIDAEGNEMEVTAGFNIFSLISGLTKGKPPVPSRVSLMARNYTLNDLTAYALNSYAASPSTNQLVVPLLQQMAIKGNLSADIMLKLNLEDPTSSDGSFDLRIDNFVLAMNTPDLSLEDQKFKKALISADLAGGSLKIREGSEFTSQDVSMKIGGNLSLRSPILTSSMNLSIPLQIKGALQEQFGFLIDAMLKAPAGGEIPLQIKGTLQRPVVSYN